MKKEIKQKQKQKTYTMVTPEHNYYAYAIILVLAFIAYVNTIPYGYVYDDTIAITGNKYTQMGFGGIGKLFSTNFFEGYYGENANMVLGGRYRPLSLISFAIEIGIFGQNPHVSHFINILLYACSGMLIYFVFSYFRKLAGKQQAWYISTPFIAALLFIVHPLHTEVVANIKGRDEILALIGALLALYYSVRFVETEKIKYFFYTALTFFVGLFSKENAITFFAIIPLSVFFFSNRPLKKVWVLYIPLVFITVIFLSIRQGAYSASPLGLENDLMNNPFVEMDFLQKYATIIYTWGVYLKLLFFPNALTYDYYPYHIPIVQLFDIKFIISMLVYGSLIWYAIKHFKSKDLLSYSILYFLITFSIVSNFLIPIGTFMNERFMFMPSVGFCLGIAYLGTDIKYVKERIWLRNAVLGIFVAVMVLFSIKTVVRNRVWETNFKLFTTDVAVSKNSSKANLQAGEYYMQEARKVSHDSLIWWFDGGMLTRNIIDTTVQKDTSLAKSYRQKAIQCLEQAVRIYPKNVPALFNLIQVNFEYNKNFEAIIDICRKLAAINPEGDLIYINLAGTLNFMPGNYAYKEKVYREFYQINPNRSDLTFALGRSIADQGRYAEALNYLSKATTMKSDFYDAWSYTGFCHSQMRDWQKALDAYHKAEHIQPTNAVLMNNIAIMYGYLGNMAMQAEYMRKAQK